MVSEKIIVVLLVLAVILSLVSIAVTLSMNVPNIDQFSDIIVKGKGSGQVKLFVEKPTGEEISNGAG